MGVMRTRARGHPARKRAPLVRVYAHPSRARGKPDKVSILHQDTAAASFSCPKNRTDYGRAHKIGARCARILDLIRQPPAAAAVLRTLDRFCLKFRQILSKDRTQAAPLALAAAGSDRLRGHRATRNAARQQATRKPHFTTLW